MTKSEMCEALSSVWLKYYKLELPNTEIEKLIDSDKWLEREIREGCVRDTLVREVSIDLFLKSIGMSSWPTFGDTDMYSRDFYQVLKIKVKQVGGKFHGLK